MHTPESSYGFLLFVLSRRLVHGLTIRTYKKEDYQELSRWYESFSSVVPHEDMLSEESTFILEMDGIPAMCQTLLMTKGTSVAYFEYLIKNPDFKIVNLEECLFTLCNHICKFAKLQGYKHIITYGKVEKLNEKYVRGGFIKATDGLSAFYRSL